MAALLKTANSPMSCSLCINGTPRQKIWHSALLNCILYCEQSNIDDWLFKDQIGPSKLYIKGYGRETKIYHKVSWFGLVLMLCELS